MIDSIREFITSSQAILTDNNDMLKSYSTALQKYCENILRQADLQNLIIQTRVKTTNSLGEKIYRKNYHQKFTNSQLFIDNLPDLIGIRIVCLLNSEEKEIFAVLQSIFSQENSIDGSIFYGKANDNDDKIFLDLSKQPQIQKNGHSIYKINCKWFDSRNSKYINCELQIKSLIHFFWGELDHMLFYKNYSYLISSGFYSQLMDKINAELENIDSQLLILKNQMDKTDEKEVVEIKQIASLILYNKYNCYVAEGLNCTIDLREVFDLLVDMHFKNTGDKRINYERLNELILEISGKHFNSNIIDLIESGTIIESELSPRTRLFVLAIDHGLKKQDIFWIYFYAIYASHFVKEEEQNYSSVIKKISEEFVQMLSEFEDNLERIIDDCDHLYDEFIDAIYTGLSEAFELNGKLNFFIYNLSLTRINSITKSIVRKYQNKITIKNTEYVHRNIRVISCYTKCLAMTAHDKYIKIEHVRELKNILAEEDFFDINFDIGTFEEDYQNMDYIKDQDFLQLFPREDE